MTDDSIYQPLASQLHAIRLLELLPGKWSDDIKAQLREFPIAEAHDRYISISYTWGQQGTVKQILITCNGTRVPISENLYTILRRLRRPDYSILVWADALCINQADPSERTHQVGLMGEIYKNSQETIIWLGESADADDTGYGFLDTYIAEEDVLCMTEGGPPRVAWQGNTSDQRLLDAYLANSAQSSSTPDFSNDIFGAFCLIQSFAQGTSRSTLRFLEENETKGKNRWTPRPLRLAVAANGGPTKASRVWDGLERLLSRPWV